MNLKRLSVIILALAAGCQAAEGSAQRSAGNMADEIVAQMVASTLEAHALQAAKTRQPDWGIDAPGEQYSVEVTQPADGARAQDSGIPADETDVNDLPASHYIWSILGHRQYFPIGCEASAADDWAKYFGVEINEFHFQVRLPLSDNPDVGFVGDVTGPWGQVPPYAYGVHAEPVARTLRDYYGIDAVAAKEFSLTELKAQIAADKPVIAWVIGNCTWSEPYEYIDLAGNAVIAAPYEHVVIVTGYNETHIRYMNNGKFYDIQNEYFERSWSVLGNMVIYLGD